MIVRNGKEVTAIYKDGREIVERYKGGRLVYSAAKDYEGYPLAISSKKDKAVKSYTIYGNTSAEAKGVGDEFTWNQLFTQQWSKNGSIMTTEGHEITIEATGNYSRIWQKVSIEGTHLYLVYAKIRASKNYTYYPIFGLSKTILEEVTTEWKEFCRIESISTSVSDRTIYIGDIGQNYATLNPITRWIDKPMLFDLTAMGIADQVNSLADFKAYLVSKGMMQSVDDELPYFDYDAGSIKTSMPIKVAVNGQATTYPSLLTSPLHKIGDIVDYKESSGKIAKRIGRIHDLVLTAGKTSSYKWLEFRGAYLSGVLDAKYNRAAYVSSHFGYALNSGTLRPNTDAFLWLGVSNPGVFVLFSVNKATSLGLYDAENDAIDIVKFVDWWNAENPTIVYVLATPTDIQGEPLPTLMLHQGDNIITTDTEVQPSNIKAKA